MSVLDLIPGVSTLRAVGVGLMCAGAASLATGPRQPQTPPEMLADVLGRCIARVRLLATAADERGAAGALCEREYDEVTADK